MTHKDYELIAAAIDLAQAHAIFDTRHDFAERAAALEGQRKAVRELVYAFQETNPRFDPGRFKEAALNGPQYRKAVNAESLARELGPGDKLPASTPTAHGVDYEHLFKR